jgi:hypothetical protein
MVIYSYRQSELVQAVGTAFVTHYRMQSRPSTSCLVNRILGLQRNVAEGNVSMSVILPNSSLNTFKGWKWKPETAAFADGYIIEVGLDSMLHLPPPSLPPLSLAAAVQYELVGSSSETTGRKRARVLEGQRNRELGPAAASAYLAYEESTSRTFSQGRHEAVSVKLLVECWQLRSSTRPRRWNGASP